MNRLLNHNGLLLVNKAKGTLSFRLVTLLRKRTGVETIGHAGTLDPFATGLMVMLVGRNYTKRSNEFLTCDKEYLATMHLGITTDTYDIDGVATVQSSVIPTEAQLLSALASFQGSILQTPPMYSAKKIGGQKLYDLARRGLTVERAPVPVQVAIECTRYEYPEVDLRVVCSKGTYVRSLAHDIGQALGVGAHLSALQRLRSGTFSLERAVPEERLLDPTFDLTPHFQP
jgi:tRNA pseudouridine55 synthase